MVDLLQDNRVFLPCIPKSVVGLGKPIDYGRISSNFSAGISMADRNFKFDVGVCMGTRRVFEDRWSVDSRVDYQAAVLGVYDGHNGAQAAEYLREHLGPGILRHPQLLSDPRLALVEAFQEADGAICLQQAVSLQRQAGSTAVVVLVLGPKLFVAHVGDSRATVISNEGKVLALTAEHRASRYAERIRLRGRGGKVEVGEDGVARVMGVLQVSRAFGHAKLKQYVTAEPEVLEFDVSQVGSVVLATDGLHDQVDNPSIVQMMMGNDRTLPCRADEIVGLARAKKVRDNVCVMIISPENMATSTHSDESYPIER